MDYGEYGHHHHHHHDRDRDRDYDRDREYDRDRDFDRPPEVFIGQPNVMIGGGCPQYYTINSRMHGLCLDVQGDRVVPWNRHGGDSQLFYDDPVTRTIRCKQNGYCLECDGSDLVLRPHRPGHHHQYWERQQDGYIRNYQHNRVLDIMSQCRDPGARVSMYDSCGYPSQMWDFQFVGAQPGYNMGGGGYPIGGGFGPTPVVGYPQPGIQPYQPDPYQQPFVPGYGQPGVPTYGPRQEFRIVSHMNQKAVDIEGGMPQRHAKLVMQHKQHHLRNQLWYFDIAGSIRSAIGDFAIEADEDNHHLRLTHHIDGDPRHRWVHDGKKIINMATGNCMDIKGESHFDGAHVIAYPYRDQHNQHWSLEYA